MSRIPKVSDKVLLHSKRLVSLLRKNKKGFLILFRNGESFCYKKRLFFLLADGFIQVFYQVVGIFNTYTQANERIGQSVFNTLFTRYRSMRHRGRMIN